MHDNMTAIGNIMRSAREAKGLTQAALAERIGVSNRTIIAIEKNKRNPTYEVLYRLVHALDISADLIFFPNHVSLSTEQTQFFREYMACDEKERRILMTTLRSLMQALRQDEPEKQS